MKEFAEFFAGVGLVRKGLEPAGWKCIWANDISSDKKEIYTANFEDDHFHLGDIWEVVDNDCIIPDDTFLFTASFPCTDLSVAGGRAGLAGVHSGTLNAVFEIILKKRDRGTAPKVVLLENVKGFLTSHKGKDVANTVRNFSELGYCVDILELDACYFTPQSRPRVFMVAVDNQLAPSVMKIKDSTSILDEYWSVFDKSPALRSAVVKKVVKENDDLCWGAFDLEFSSERTLSLSDIVESFEPDSPIWWNKERKEKLISQMSERHFNQLQEMMTSDRLTYGTVYRRVRKGQSMAEMRSDGIAGCLRTPRGGSSKQILIEAGFGECRVRHMSSREYARLQGVDDSFFIPDGTKGYFAMGDAVCVPVIEYLAHNVITPIYDAFYKQLSLINTLHTNDKNCNA